MTALAYRLFAACLILSSSLPAAAADVWFYELREPPRAGHVWNQPLLDNNKHWLLTEFEVDPYPGQLPAMREPGNAQKISLVFKRSPAPALADDYVAVARAWRSQGIEHQFKFVGTLPTEQEAKILAPVCELGTKIVFITNSIPTAYEAANLQTLKTCVEVDFALGRYMKYSDVNDFKLLQGLSLVFVNNYFPSYAHVDTLNLIDNPVALRVTDSVPSADQITLLNQVKRLTSLHWELNLFPMDEQYALFSRLERGPSRRFGLRWALGTPRDQDVEAWVHARPHRIQVSRDVFQAAGVENRLRALDGEVLVEMFSLRNAKAGLMEKTALRPQL